MHLFPFSLLIIQVVTFALPATSLYISPRVEAPDSTQLKPEKVDLNGTVYTATPLSYGDQGTFSHAFKIEGGFQANGKPVPAILKRVFEKEGSDNPNSKTLKEIGFLKRPSVGLYLFSKWSKTNSSDLPYQIDIVVRDLTGSDPPLKPFHEWYHEDESIRALEGLENVYNAVKTRLLWYAQNENLLYKDFHMRNIFIQKQVITDKAIAGTAEGNAEPNVQIMFADWGPPDDEDSPGVVDIADESDKEELIQKYRESLDPGGKLEGYFAVYVLAAVLGDNGQKLRSNDVETVEFQGKTLEILRIRHAGKRTVVYEIVGGFEKGKEGRKENVPAIMSIRDLKKGEKIDWRMRVPGAGVILASEERGGKYMTIYSDASGGDDD